LCRAVAGSTDDPFRVVRIAADAIKADPARLSDEARAMALGGGRRVVRVDGAGDALTLAMRSLFDDPDFGPDDALIVVDAGALAARSSLRKLFEGEATAAAVACYADDARDIARLIGETLGGHGIEVSRDAAAYLAAHLGGDRAVSRGELKKLALYMGGAGTVELADAIASVGDSAATALDDACFAAAGGDYGGLDKALARAVAEGVHGVAILRAAGRHVMRLHQAAGIMSEGKSADQAVRALRPPVIFFQVERFRAQLSRWSPGTLSRALDVLIEAEIDCKTTGMPADAVTGRALMRIAQMARRG